MTLHGIILITLKNYIYIYISQNGQRFHFGFVITDFEIHVALA